MTFKPPGPGEVRPNTLAGQSEPNTFRSQSGMGAVGRQELNSGGGNAGPAILSVRPELRLLVYVALVVVTAVVVLYVLSSTT
jgi:hypothetical protein